MPEVDRTVIPGPPEVTLTLEEVAITTVLLQEVDQAIPLIQEIDLPDRIPIFTEEVHLHQEVLVLLTQEVVQLDLAELEVQVVVDVVQAGELQEDDKNLV